jgi:mycofactocin precursor
MDKQLVLDEADAPVLSTESHQESAEEELVEQELLIEDVSIDGMCGVY